MSVISDITGALDKVGQAVTRVADTLPMVANTIQSASDAVTTGIKGKQPTIAPSQQPAAVGELVPRDMGNLSGVAGGITGTMLLIGGIAIAAVFFMAKRR